MPALAPVLNWVITVILSGMIVIGVALYLLLPNTPAAGVLIAAVGALGLILPIAARRTVDRKSKGLAGQASQRLPRDGTAADFDFVQERRRRGSSESSLSPGASVFGEGTRSHLE